MLAHQRDLHRICDLARAKLRTVPNDTEIETILIQINAAIGDM